MTSSSRTSIGWPDLARPSLFDRVFPYQTDLYTLDLPASARLAAGSTGPAFAYGGETTLPNGNVYHMYTLSNLAPNTRVSARFTNVASGAEGSNRLWIHPRSVRLAAGSSAWSPSMAAGAWRRRQCRPGKPARRPRGATTVRTVPTEAAVVHAPTPAAEVSAEDLVVRRERLINDSG